MANRKPTEMTVEETVDEVQQRIAQMEMEAQKRVDEMLAEAEKKQRQANEVLESAKLAAASIPATPRKSFDKEISEAEKLNLTDRMKRQYGADVEMVHTAVPLGSETREGILGVVVNGISYEFKRGEVYDIAKPLYDLIMGSYRAGIEAEAAAPKL